MKKRWKVMWKVLGVIAASLVMFCVLHRAYWQAKFNRKLAELKADGQLMTFEDLDAYDSLPEGTPNAADIYLQAFSHYQEPDKALIPFLPIQGTYEMPDDASPLPDEVLDAISKSLKANEQTLALLDQGAKIKDCAFPRKRPLDMNDQELFINIKSCGELLCDRNIYLAQTGQAEKLFVVMPSLLKFSECPIRRGTLIDEMIACALKVRAAQSLEYGMNQEEFTDSQLAYLQKQFSGAQDLEACCRGLIKERIYYLANVQSPFNERIEKPNTSNQWRERIHSMAGLMQKESVMHLDYLQRCVEASKFPVHERPDEFYTIICDLADAFSPISWGIYIHSIASNLDVARIDMRVIGQLRCAETALAVERYRLKHGALPEVLGDLVPEFMAAVPLDPFSGEELGYILEEPGYRIYTIGDDWEDNDGLSKDEMKAETGEDAPEEYDWPFVVRR